MGILVEVSGNKDVAKKLKRYYAKRKLIQTGEKDWVNKYYKYIHTYKVIII